MNVLLVCPFDGPAGGVVLVVGNLAQYLQQKGHRVLFFLKDEDSPFVTEGKTSWGFDSIKLRFGAPPAIKPPLIRKVLFLGLIPITLYRLAKAIRKYNIDVVNVHYPVDAFAFFAVCRVFLPIKLVISVHGADVFPDGAVPKKYSLAMRFLLQSADLVIANSKAFRDDFVRVFPALADKSLFIHNGIDLTELDGPAADESQNTRGRYVLCIAAHNEKKAIDILIRALPLLRDIDPPFKLLLAGDGPLRQKLEALASSLGVQDRVEFLGHQERHQIKGLLHGCEAFVLPSRSEPFGVAIIEALACRKPVVASAVGGIPEIIEHGTSGILVAPDDPELLAEGLRSVLTDSDLKRKLGANGYSRVTERFCLEHTGAAYEAVLMSLSFPQSRP
jgi:glycosyltransferase involved in cell wall biosynthesis